MVSIVAPDFKPFWKEGLSEDEYHADKTAVSSTGLRECLKSPAHFRAMMLNTKPRDSEALRFGRAAHLAILDSKRFMETYRVEPNFGDQRSSKNRELKQHWLSQLPSGVVVVSQDERDKLLGMIESLQRKTVAVNLIKGAALEVSGWFRDKETGLLCRIRPDILRLDLSALPDLKTTHDASREGFQRSAWKYGYFTQLAFYSMGVEAICGKAPDIHCFIAIEKEPPFAVSVFEIDVVAMDYARAQVRKGLDRLKNCIVNNQWPDYQETPEYLSVPRWVGFEA